MFDFCWYISSIISVIFLHFTVKLLFVLNVILLYKTNMFTELYFITT